MVLKGLDPVLRSLGIEHDRYRKVELCPDLLDQIDLLLMLLMRTV